MANYDINYDDTRFQKVESDKTAALNEVDKTYGDMISKSDKFYQQQIDASKSWADKQAQIQNEKTDFAIEEINQQKEQAKKDYTKEQSGAYVDWRKQSNEYGVNAEEMASAGLANTGYSESSQVSMYNQYQNRVATALESFNRATQTFNNNITQARLQNNAAVAEIYAKAYEKQLQLSLEGFQYKNTLVQAKADKKLAVDSEYNDRYQDVLKQINTENALAEEVRQYNEKMAEEKRQFNESMAFQKEQFNWQKAQASSSGGGGGGGGNGGGGGDEPPYITPDKDDDKKITGSGKNEFMPKATAQSILDLGGPYNADYVASQVKSGKVVERKNAKGETVFVKNPGGALITPAIPSLQKKLEDDKKKNNSTVTKLKNSIKSALKSIKGWVGG